MYIIINYISQLIKKIKNQINKYKMIIIQIAIIKIYKNNNNNYLNNNKIKMIKNYL